MSEQLNGASYKHPGTSHLRRCTANSSTGTHQLDAATRGLAELGQNQKPSEMESTQVSQLDGRIIQPTYEMPGDPVGVIPELPAKEDDEKVCDPSCSSDGTEFGDDEKQPVHVTEKAQLHGV